MIKVLLALLMIRETWRLVVARFALRVLYRKQTITYISTQTRSTGKTQIRDLTRKFNLRTPVCKKYQIKRSNETQTAKETRSVY